MMARKLNDSLAKNLTLLNYQVINIFLIWFEI